MREPKKVRLEVSERFAVMGLLPEKAGFLNMKLIRELREALVLTPEERELAKVVEHPDGNLSWKAEDVKDVVAEIAFDPAMYVIVMKALEKLDTEAGLEANQVTLYEKFVVCPDAPDRKDGPRKVVADD